MKKLRVLSTAYCYKAMITMLLAGVAIAAPSIAVAQAGWAVGDNGTLLCTQNAGRNWTLVAGIPPVNLNAVSVGDTTHAWAVGDGGVVLTYDDNDPCNQQSWIADTVTDVNLRGVYFRNGGFGWEGWAVGGNKIIHTINGGIDWGPDNMPNDVAQLYAVFGSGNAVWAVGVDTDGNPELLSYDVVAWVRTQLGTSQPNAARAGFVQANGTTGLVGGDGARVGNPGVGVLTNASGLWSQVYAITGIQQRYRSRLNAMTGLPDADGNYRVFAAGGSESCPVISIGTTWRCILSFRYVGVGRSDPDRSGFFGASFVDAAGQKGLWVVGNAGAILFNSDPTANNALRRWVVQSNPQPRGHREKLNGVAMVANAVGDPQ